MARLIKGAPSADRNLVHSQDSTRSAASIQAFDEKIARANIEEAELNRLRGIERFDESAEAKRNLYRERHRLWLLNFRRRWAL
jgi:hypothetical protein